ncbi:MULTISPECIES: hypothetical protein [Calothrix]|uniref:Uncharacterized protein n=2 Tax=Calothrix TaxID=1186 RepID=A0ABR8AA52_9CYAN|nr:MULTISPECIES: hypothetical protein [Calothrix]MBD2196816.1 hypothetical protein [Calothrix parietina FACHB-288]MBD2225368.1 hypothetical protein [Calothrix anomala FACHB-343]
MQNQNADPHLLKCVLNADINQLQQINQMLIHRLVEEVYKHECRIRTLEQQNQEILLKLNKLENLTNANTSQLQENQELISFIEAEIPYLRHLVYKNDDLENRLAFLEPSD